MSGAKVTAKKLVLKVYPEADYYGFKGNWRIESGEYAGPWIILGHGKSINEAWRSAAESLKDRK